jgi:hypothetical protein
VIGLWDSRRIAKRSRYAKANTQWSQKGLLLILGSSRQCSENGSILSDGQQQKGDR